MGLPLPLNKFRGKQSKPAEAGSVYIKKFEAEEDDEWEMHERYKNIANKSGGERMADNGFITDSMEGGSRTAPTTQPPQPEKCPNQISTYNSTVSV
jgi:hypothetical protein